MVTGAFGYSGRYIARRLIERGCEVRTLTDSPRRGSEFEGRVGVFPFSFDDPDRLAASLEGVRTLYNTYWVRFDHKRFNHRQAIENTRILFDSARRAGVERVVHVSITNPSEDSPLPYFRGKAELERALAESGMSHAILRPAVIFGREDILVNNIAWTLRRFPAFAVFGDGSCRLRPIYVDDLAKLAVEAGADTANAVIDAVGPETFTFRELVRVIGESIGRPRPVFGAPPFLARWVASCIGLVQGDVSLTAEEIEGLMGNLLCVESPPAGSTRLTEWTRANADILGRRYANELARRRHRDRPYDEL